MKREVIENAIVELECLIEEDPSEEVFQKWFEDNQFIFEVLGYCRVVPHPQIESSEGDYIPDFMTVDTSWKWNIFELKRPSTKVLLDKPRRSKFYADFEGYLSQCAEYSALFDEKENRKNFNSKYMPPEIIKSPPICLVAGRRKDFSDAEKMNNLLGGRIPQVDLIAYDDILSALERRRQSLYGFYEGRPGLSICQLLILDRSPDGGDNYIFDIGCEENRNRVTLKVEQNRRLVLEVFDSNGLKNVCSSDLGAEDSVFERPIYIVIDICGGEENSAVFVEINGVVATSLMIPSLKLGSFDPLNIVKGSDITGAESSYFRDFEFLMFNSTLTFESRVQLMRGLCSKHYDLLFNIQNYEGVCLKYEGKTCMYNEGHSILAPETSYGKNLIQSNSSRSPELLVTKKH